MARKILAGTLLALSSILLAFSVVGIAAIWIYNEQLTSTAMGRLKEIDGELAQAQATLQSSEKELERAVRIVDATEKALQKLVKPSGSSENIFASIQGTLDDRLIPDLKSTRSRIDAARTTLEDLRSGLTSINSFIPFVDLNAPDKVLADLIVSATSIDSDIADMEVVATVASRAGTWSAWMRAAQVVRIPAVSMLSLSATGIPWSGPVSAPIRKSRSARRASA